MGEGCDADEIWLHLHRITIRINEMTRTETGSLPLITVTRPNNSIVTFRFPAENSSYARTTIILPQGSTWSASPHWHERYTEHFRVLQGRVRILIDGTATEITPTEGEQTIPRYTVHDFMRADAGYPGEEQDEGDVIVEEWCDPCEHVPRAEAV